MNRAQLLIDRMFLGETPAVAPAPTKTPTRTPTAPPAPSKPRPGTRPWQPSKRPDVAPRPKARGDGKDEDEDEDLSEAGQTPVSVPPPPSPGSQSGPDPAPLSSLCDIIRAGDRVTIMSPHGSRLSGRATMRNRQRGCWVLNLGGAHGTPGTANDDNIIAINRGGKRIYGRV